MDSFKITRTALFVLLSLPVNVVVDAVKTLHQKPQTDGVTNWQEAKSFCEAEGGTLVTKNDLCKYFAETNKIEGGDYWGPALDEPGDFFQISHGETDFCQAFDDSVECPSSSSLEDGAALCSLPADCTTQKCAYTCDLPAGYYPDPTDCRSYCKCTGTTAPSRYETVTGNDMIWDPWGRSYWTDIHGPATPSYKPLSPTLPSYKGDYPVPNAGMNGGIKNYYYNNKLRAYCGDNYDRNNWRTKSRRLLEPKQQQLSEPRNLASCEPEVDYILCDIPSPAPSPTDSGDTPTAPVEPPNPSPTPGSYGDPHVLTWGKTTQFDFHGECDLVLLNNPSFKNGLGMDIHIRTKIETSSWWSYIQNAVVRIGNDTLEVTGGRYHQYIVNGVPGDKNTKNFLFSSLGLQVIVRRTTSHQMKVRIDLLNGDAIGFEVFKQFVRVNVKYTDPKWKKFEGSVGLMGSYPLGETVGRDGKTVFTDMNAFGQEWQVRDNEAKLFHTVSGPQHPNKCIMPSEISPEEKRRRLGEAMITQEDAELACENVNKEDFDACIFDVLATNDLEMAGSY